MANASGDAREERPLSHRPHIPEDHYEDALIAGSWTLELKKLARVRWLAMVAQARPQAADHRSLMASTQRTKVGASGIRCSECGGQPARTSMWVKAGSGAKTSTSPVMR